MGIRVWQRRRGRILLSFSSVWARRRVIAISASPRLTRQTYTVAGCHAWNEGRPSDRCSAVSISADIRLLAIPWSCVHRCVMLFFRPFDHVPSRRFLPLFLVEGNCKREAPTAPVADNNEESEQNGVLLHVNIDGSSDGTTFQPVYSWAQIETTVRVFPCMRYRKTLTLLPPVSVKYTSLCTTTSKISLTTITL